MSHEITPRSFSPGAGRWIALPIAFLLAAIVRLPYGFGPFSADEYAYVVMAREILSGDLPLTHAWLNRGPIGFLVYTITAALPFEIDRSLTYTALTLAAVTAYFVYLLLSARISPKWGWFGLIAYALTSADPAIQANGANMELPIAALVTMSLWSAFVLTKGPLRGRLFLAGIAIGLALGMKETAAAFALPLLPACRWGEGRRLLLWDLGTIASGMALPTALVWATYGLSGNSELLVAILSFHAGYSGLKLVDLVRGPLLFLVERGDALYVFWPLLVPATWLLAEVPWRAGFSLTVRLLLVASCLAVIAPGKYFGHHYIHFQLPLILSAAIWLNAIRERVTTRAAIDALAVAFVLWAGILEVRMASGRVPLVVRQLSAVAVSGAAEREIGRELERRACDGDRLFVFGWAPTIYAHAGLRPAAPDIWGMTMSNQLEVWNWSMEPWLVRRTRGALLERPPEWIVIAERSRGGEVDRTVEQLVAAEYVSIPIAVESEGVESRPMDVFRRRDATICASRRGRGR